MIIFSNINLEESTTNYKKELSINENLFEKIGNNDMDDDDDDEE